MLEKSFVRRIVFFFSVVLSVGWVWCEQPLVVQQEVVHQESEAALNDDSVPAGLDKDIAQLIKDPQDFAKLLNDLLKDGVLKKEAERRSQLLQVLPEALRLRIEAVSKSYQTFAQSMRLENSLSELCQKIHQALACLDMPEAALRDDLILSLDELNKAIANGTFVQIALPQQLSGNPLDIQNLLMQVFQFSTRSQEVDKTFTQESLSALVQKLDTFKTLLTPQVCRDKQALPDDLALLNKLLKHAEKKDSKNFCHECIALVRPQYAVFAQEIKDVLALLADAQMHDDASADPVLKEAIAHWLRQLKTYQQTLRSFFILAADAELDLSSILCYMSRFYELISVVFEANRYDLFGSSNFTDGVFRGTIMLMAYFHRYSQTAAQAVQKYVIGNGDLSKFANPFDQIEYKVVSLFQVLPVFWNPVVFSERLSFTKLVFLRIAGAFGLFHYLRAVKRAGEKKTIWPDEKEKEPIWPNEDVGMRMVLSGVIRDARVYASGHIQNKIMEHVAPETLEQIEHFTMGLVKPELIDVAFEVLIPLFCAKNQRLLPIADFTEYDFLRYEWGFCHDMVDQYTKKYPDEKDQQAHSFREYVEGSMNFYVKYSLLSYTLKNLFRFWGSALARVSGGKIAQWGYGVVKNVSSFIDRNFISENPEESSVQDQFDSVEISVKEGFDSLRMVLIALFQEESMERALVVSFLKNMDFLKEQTTDPLRVNDRIITKTLDYLVDYHVLTYSQVGDLLDQYYQNRTNIVPFIDILIRTLQENLTGVAGGAIGCLTGGLLARFIAWKYWEPQKNI